MILVSIVGDFQSSIIPIFYEFKDDITKHILVYDDFKNDVSKAKSLKKGIKAFTKKYNYKFETLEYVLDEDSIDSLKECAKFILSQTSDAKDIFLNTTDGFSTLTTILNQALFKKGVNFIAYDMYDNQYNLLNQTKLEKFDIENGLSIGDHFLLKGYGVKRSDVKKIGKKYEKEIKKLFEKDAGLYNKFIKHPATSKTIKSLSNEYKDIKKLFISMGFENYTIKDPIFTGTMFELYIFNLLKNLDIDDIEIGLKVFRTYKNTEIFNEFDILIMKNNHLHMIECKYRNNIKLEELIYKYIAIADIIDEDGKMLLVTKKEPLYNTAIDNDKSRGKVYKRGKLSNITVLGGVANNPLKFILNVKEQFNLK